MNHDNIINKIKNQYSGIRLGRFCRFTFVLGQNYESVAEEFYLFDGNRS